VYVSVLAYPPDHRKRDIDNIIKPILDSLQHGGVFDDDNQVSMFSIERMNLEKNGRVVVTVSKRTQKA
jgi:crossover junction endodeoxyribonuclease RusA